jgi:hypothetical protein
VPQDDIIHRVRMDLHEAGHLTNRRPAGPSQPAPDALIWFSPASPPLSAVRPAGPGVARRVDRFVPRTCPGSWFGSAALDAIEERSPADAVILAGHQGVYRG